MITHDQCLFTRTHAHTYVHTCSPVQPTVVITVKGGEVITKFKESGKVGGSPLSTAPQQRGPTCLVLALHQV